MADQSTPPSNTPPSNEGHSGSPGGTGGGGAGGGSGLEENVAGALSYLFGAVTGIIFLILDKDRPFVRFHAVQSLVVTVAMMAVSIALMIVGAVPVIGWLISLLGSIGLMLAGFALWLMLMYKAFEGEEWEVPVLGEYARKYEKKV